MTTLLATTFAKPIIILHLLMASPAPALLEHPANDVTFAASTYVTKANKIRIAIDKPNCEPMTISLRPVGQRNVVFTEHVHRKITKATLLLDVDQLADGVYELELKTSSGQLIKQIDLRTPAKVASVQRQLTLE
jgi:hypothetical protein